jgi:hypothetical protein
VSISPVSISPVSISPVSISPVSISPVSISPVSMGPVMRAARRSWCVRVTVSLNAGAVEVSANLDRERIAVDHPGA